MDCGASTRILGLEGFRVERVEWESEDEQGRCGSTLSDVAPADTNVPAADGGHGACAIGRSGPDDLPWAEQRVTLIYGQRRVDCRTCGIRTERVAFADPKARITRGLRQVIGLDCQSMPTSHAAVRPGVSWSKARRAEQAF
jgi:transposase